MAITITSPGDYTVVPGETYIIDPSASGNITFLPSTSLGLNDFTVEISSSNSNNASIYFGGNNPSSPLAPTVNIAEGVQAPGVGFFNALNTGGIASVDYNLADGSSIGLLTGVSGTDPNVVKTTVTGRDNVTIGGFDNNVLTGSKSVITLGDNATITGPINADTGGLDLTAGDNFEYTYPANMNFDAALGDCSVKLGANADTHGQSFSMGNSGPNYSVEVGNGSDIGHIFMGGGFGDKTVMLGEDVNTGNILIGGSGGETERMQITLVAGNGTHIGGNIGLGGNYVDRTITFGDDVHVGGLLGMGGTFGTNTVTIGNRYTQEDYFTGSTSGTDTIVIGDDWQFNSTFTLQGGNDSLQIGSTSRDMA
ncbi:hypothetical protein, partial [Paracoccus sp. (in: a-proteobacteria)]|uniref:hypothetical protein n=1 Tax=Paracoccus sp. TaxID=267 RepID=UPI0028A82240